MGWMDGEGLVHDVEKKKKIHTGNKTGKKRAKRKKREKPARRTSERENLEILESDFFYGKNREKSCAASYFRG